MTIVFRNSGLIDIAAVTTMGVSVKKAGSFGYFGTGLKFSIATILRGGGTVTIWRGPKGYAFRTKDVPIRGEMFQMVTMNGKQLGFTTQLGKNWEPWMAFRELGCNCRDEDGQFTQTEAPAPAGENETLIVVNWASMDAVYDERATIFAEGELVHETPRLRILVGPSNHLYYRGVRVAKLEQPSSYTYDIQEQQTLTEDRTLSYSWVAPNLVRDVLLKEVPTEVLAGMMTPEAESWEGKLNWDADDAPEPSKAFVDVVLDARDARSKTLLSRASMAVTKLHRRQTEYGGGSYERLRDDNLGRALTALKYLGFKGVEDEINVIKDLPEGTLSMVERKRIYVHPDIVTLSPHDIAERLARHMVDVHAGFGCEGEYLIPMILNLATELRETKADPAFITPVLAPAEQF